MGDIDSRHAEPVRYPSAGSGGVAPAHGRRPRRLLYMLVTGFWLATLIWCASFRWPLPAFAIVMLGILAYTWLDVRKKSGADRDRSRRRDPGGAGPVWGTPDEGEFADSSDPMAPHSFRRRWRRFILTLAACAGLSAFVVYWRIPPKREYLVLPTDHSKVERVSWVGSLALGFYRAVYLRTRVGRPWGPVLDDITTQLAASGRAGRPPGYPTGVEPAPTRIDATRRTSSRAARGWAAILQRAPGHSYDIESHGILAANFIDWDAMVSAADELDRIFAIAQVSGLAVPLGHLPTEAQGGSVPGSFVSFAVPGPDDKRFTDRPVHHRVFYRLTDVDKRETVVEIWDMKYFDH